jgi:pyruvate-formate lyase-activating enzyme
VGAILPPGYLRLALPAYVDDASGPPLRPRPYAAVGADAGGDLVVAAAELESARQAADARAAPDLPARINAALRDRPSSRIVRQLARCAKDYRCRAAANAFVSAHDCALPVSAPANEHPSTFISLRDEAEAAPTELAAFKPSPDEIADAAVRHFEAGGTIVAFGRACEGEPLLAVRLVEAAILAIRARTPIGTIHLETNGSVPAALKRICEAGLDSVAIRLVSARASTFDSVQRPDGFRLSDVRASIAEAVNHKIAVALIILVLPGMTDRGSELDALVALAGELPDGSALLLRNLAADPQRALADVRSQETPLGVAHALERLRSDAAHVRIASLPRPLART